MGIMGIKNRARGMQMVENGFHVHMMFLLLGLLLSIVNLPIVSGDIEVPPSPFQGGPGQLPIPPLGSSEDSSPPSPTPTPSAAPSPASYPVPPPPPAPSPASYPVPPPPPPPANTPPSPNLKSVGDTWNESEKAGVVIASIAALLQVAVVAFLLIKRHQMLTTVEYDDIDDVEYIPPDSNFRDIESA